MTELARPSSAEMLPDAARFRWLRALLSRPALLLVVLSAVFGTLIVFVNPPLRGPDEPAHFVRIYGFLDGILLPSAEVNGRKGLYLPAALHDDYMLFKEPIGKVWTPGFSYWSVLDAYRERRNTSPTAAGARAPVFETFEGSEAYNPAAYLPYLPAGLVARVLGLDFVPTIYLMRFAGLAAFTALAAYAIAMTPCLKWAFFLIAMLPASIFGRSVVGADGAVLGFTLVGVALSLRAMAGILPGRPWERALWMTLNVLSKPPQIAFVLLEPMIYRTRTLTKHWRVIALVVLPGTILSLLWIWGVKAEVAAWRVYGDGAIAEQFSVGWKLRFMLENPLHFPKLMFTTLYAETFGLWRQVIGVLGYLDTHLFLGFYIAISIALTPVLFDRLELRRGDRVRIAVFSAAMIIAYTVAVFLILYITFTPSTEPQIWGVQGRYFVVILPLVAIILSAIFNCRLPAGMLAGVAIVGALLSGFASLEALWRVNWTGLPL